jgi:hypothetical protein
MTSKNIENLSNNPILETANLNKQSIIFSVENKDKIINLLKKNELNVFTKENVNNLIKMISSENKGKIRKLLDNVDLIKNNGLLEENKKIINELLKIKELIKKNINKELNKKNIPVNNPKETLITNNRVNRDKITRMINAIHIYFNILEPDIQEIFNTLFRQNSKNEISEKESNIKAETTNSRILYYNKMRHTLNLLPCMYDSNIPGNFKINRNSLIGEGVYGKVYKNIVLINQNKEKKLTYIFKRIKDNENDLEFKSLIFNICLLASLYLTHNDGIKYFCDLYEFGKIKDNPKSYYAIIENGGIELYKYPIMGKTLKNKLYDVLIIIKQCAEAILVLHKIGIIHCDVKSENFLLKKDNDENHIKIIDFGFSKKNGTVVDHWFGTQHYSPSNFFISTHSNPKDTRYTITVKNDIYALGIIFIELLFKVFRSEAKITVNNKLYHEISKKLYLNKLNKLKRKIDNIIDENITAIIDKLNLNIILRENVDFIDNLHNILLKITYLEDGYNYNDLSEFISDIDNLLDILKNINI